MPAVAQQLEPEAPARGPCAQSRTTGCLASPPGRPLLRKSLGAQLTWGRSGKNLPAFGRRGGGPGGDEPPLMRNPRESSVGGPRPVQTLPPRAAWRGFVQTFPRCAGRNAGGGRLWCILDYSRTAPSPVKLQGGRRGQHRAGAAPGRRKGEDPHPESTLPMDTPACPGPRPLPPSRKRSPPAPTRPVLTLLLLVSVKQVRAVYDLDCHGDCCRGQFCIFSDPIGSCGLSLAIWEILLRVKAGMINPNPSIQRSSWLTFWHISCKSFIYVCVCVAEVMMHKVFCSLVFPFTPFYKYFPMLG